MKQPIILLIDGDVYAYQAASATENNVTFDGANYVRTGSLPDAVRAFEDTIQTYLNRFKAASCVIALTDGENFRKGIFPAYKDKRNPAAKPVTLAPLREHILASHNTYQRPGLEADDVLGILATSTKILPAESRRIIVSFDKDMLTVPGEFWHSKWDKRFQITEGEADYRHMVQTLTGDITDGYGGCPGIGPVKAAKLLEEGVTGGYSAMWPVVVKAYEKAGLTERDALTQARVARILRVTDYDFKKKEVKLWKP